MAEDFCVDPLECMGCGYPPVLAPDLMGFAKSNEGYWQCRFVRQPQIKRKKIKPARKSGLAVVGRRRIEARTNGSSNASLY
jgi:hypothetical protein